MTAPADSDSDPPPRVAIPWWRQRFFYLVTGLLAIALTWGGWVWWYRADFPMHYIRLVALRAGDRPAEWLVGHQRRLMDWKLNRETRLLRLVGTAWRNKETGARLIFGRNGRLRFDDKSALIFCPLHPFMERNAETGMTAAALDGVRYEFRPQNRPRVEDPWVAPPTIHNLFLQETPWHGLVECHSDRRQISTILSSKDNRPEQGGIFTRLPDP